MTPRRLRWGIPERSAPKHPYRDTLLVYACLAVVIVIFAAATGGSLREAVLLAIVFFIAASAWSLVRWRQIVRREQRKREELGDR